MKNKSVLDGIKGNIQMEINTAFEKGYTQGNNDGYERGIKDGNINNGTFAKKIKEAYENGLNKAWEAAKKIALSPEDGGIANHIIDKIFDCSYYYVFEKFSITKIIEKLKAWEEKQKAEEEFKVGDEVTSDAFDDKGIITHITPDGAVAIISSGSSMMKVGKSGLHKTGRTFPQIAEILKQMKEDQE